MKALILIASLALLSCQKQVAAKTDDVKEPEKIVFNTTIPFVDQSTEFVNFFASRSPQSPISESCNYWYTFLKLSIDSATLYYRDGSRFEAANGWVEYMLGDNSKSNYYITGTSFSPRNGSNMGGFEFTCMYKEYPLDQIEGSHDTLLVVLKDGSNEYSFNIPATLMETKLYTSTHAADGTIISEHEYPGAQNLEKAFKIVYYLKPATKLGS